MEVLTIKDLAFNAVCGEGIFASELISPVINLDNTQIELVNTGSDLVITVPQDMIGKRFTIHNAVGQMVFSEEIPACSFDVPVQDLAGGLYVAGVEPFKGSSIKFFKADW